MQLKQTTAYFIMAWSLWVSWTPATKAATDIELQVGIVQRFGAQPEDKLTISSTQGDTLQLTFKGGNMQEQTLSTDSFDLEISQAPLEQPVLEERLVLSDHGTFETAEESAKVWQERGVAVEVSQPGRWQVWAKREVYSTPLLRRLLIESLQAQGFTTAHLETQVKQQNRRVSFVVDGYRYNRQELKIKASKNPIQVSQGERRVRRYLYGGTIKVQPNAYGNFTLVNRVKLETYLRGVVPHEIGAGAPYNAIEAQAILARTYALRNLRRFAADNYQLCADTHCQVYRGLTGTAANTDRAIRATKGQVLTYDSELVDALYSATTGGVTAFFSDVWDGEERPYLKPVIDAPTPVWNLLQNSLADEKSFRNFLTLEDGFNEAQRSLFRWNRSSSLDKLNNDLKGYLQKTRHPLANFKTIESMGVTERSPSGRVLTLSVQTDQGVVELEKNEARSAFGPPLSTLFYVEPVYEALSTSSGTQLTQSDSGAKILKGFAFIGGGFGHGVGMSQYGSYNLARLGWSTEQILQFYYPGTQIRPLSEDIVFE